MNEDLSRRLRRFERLVEVGRLALAAADRDELLKVMTQATTDLLEADRAGLFLAQPERGEIWSKVVEGGEVQEIRLPIGTGIVGDVCRTGKMVNSSDVHRDSRLVPGVDLRSGNRAHSILCCPVRGRGGAILGAIEAVSKRGNGGFHREDEELLSLLAAHCALALEQMRQTDTLVQENLSLRRRLDEGEIPCELVGASAPMRDLVRRVERLAPTPSNVLLQGEPGTGKEVVARKIHRLSPRAGRPFVRVHCAAIAEERLEAELFGSERAGGTAAGVRKPGFFEVADGGTLFLDGVAELPLPVQGRLARVLQGREIVRLGGTRPRPADVRVVSSTRGDLAALVAGGAFHEDLFYRLNVIVLRLPPLRDREGDVALLAEHFLDRIRVDANRRVLGFRAEALQRLIAHRWPGNVRELKSVIERAVLLGTSEWVEPRDLEISGGGAPALPGSAKPLAQIVADIERAHILKALSAAGGRKSQAARTLGMNRTTFLYKLKKLSAEA